VWHCRYFGAQNPVHLFNLNRFEQIAAVNNLTKLHLSMSKSWLTPDYFFFVSLLRKYLRSLSAAMGCTSPMSRQVLPLVSVCTIGLGVMEDFSDP
jgi:hypothetical protein